MKSPQVCYDAEKSVFTARSDTGSLDTFFVFPTELKEGDKLPTLKYYIPQTKKSFCFDGQFNALTDNLEFLFDGPKGFSYKICLSIDPGSQQPYVWKTKKHGQTTGFDAQEDAVMYVPRYVCLEGSTAVEAEREVIAHPTLYGTTIMQTFCTMRLKIAIVEGNEWHKIGTMVHKEDYHLTYHRVTRGERPASPDREVTKGKGGGDVVPMTPLNDEEKELTIDRKYKVIIVTDSSGKTERKTSRTERLQMKQVRPVTGEVAFAPFDTEDRRSQRSRSSSSSRSSAEETSPSEADTMEKGDASKTRSASFSSQVSSDSKAVGTTSLPTSTSQPSGTKTSGSSQTAGILRQSETSQPTESTQPTGTSSSQPSGITSSQPSGITSSQPSGTTSSQPSGTSGSQPTGTTSSQPSGPEPKIVRISGSGTKSTERSSSASTTATSTSKSSSSYSKAKRAAKMYSDDENEVFRFQYDELKVPCDSEKKKGRGGLAKFFKWKPSASEVRKMEHDNQGEPLMLMDAGSNYSIGDSTDPSKSKPKSLGKKEPAKPMVLMDAGSSYSTMADSKDKAQASILTGSGSTATKKTKKILRLPDQAGQKVPKPVVLMDAGSSYGNTDGNTELKRTNDTTAGSKTTQATRSQDVKPLAEDNALAKPMVLMDAGSSYAVTTQTASKDASAPHPTEVRARSRLTRNTDINKDTQLAKPMAMMEAGSALDYAVAEPKTQIPYKQSSISQESKAKTNSTTLTAKQGKPLILMDAGSNYSIGDKNNPRTTATASSANSQATKTVAEETLEKSKPLVLLRETEGASAPARPPKSSLATLASVEDKVSQTTSSEAATATQGKGPARPMMLMDAGSSYDMGDKEGSQITKSMDESVEEDISEELLMNAGTSYSSGDTAN